MKSALPLIPAALALALSQAACAPLASSPVCLAGAHLGPDGFCRTQRAPIHQLPFRPGYITRVAQGYHGWATHKGDEAFSLDFRCEEGDPVVATRSGTVFAVREDSALGCDDETCMDDANYVVIDHGDGTFSEYHHLRHLGALVEVAQPVCKGQVIAICGNTGYSGGPHLHYALYDATHRTIPVQFLEAVRQSGLGFPAPQTEYRSQNQRSATCPAPPTTELQRDAFVHHGIILDATLPTMVRDPRQPFTLRGTYYGGAARLTLHRRRQAGGAWVDECLEPDEDGQFSFTTDWDDPEFGDGIHWMMITGSDEQCTSHGWGWSYRIQVLR